MYRKVVQRREYSSNDFFILINIFIFAQIKNKYLENL